MKQHVQGVSNRDIKLENTLRHWQSGRKPILKLCGAHHVTFNNNAEVESLDGSEG